MPTNLEEAAFEEHISTWLVEHGGYADIKRGQSPPDYDAASGLDAAELFAFIGATQGAEWGELLTRYGNDRLTVTSARLRRIDGGLDAHARPVRVRQRDPGRHRRAEERPHRAWRTNRHLRTGRG